jgi:hypothetical protein
MHIRAVEAHVHGNASPNGECTGADISSRRTNTNNNRVGRWAGGRSSEGSSDGGKFFQRRRRQKSLKLFAPQITLPRIDGRRTDVQPALSPSFSLFLSLSLSLSLALYLCLSVFLALSFSLTLSPSLPSSLYPLHLCPPPLVSNALKLWSSSTGKAVEATAQGPCQQCTKFKNHSQSRARQLAPTPPTTMKKSQTHHCHLPARWKAWAGSPAFHARERPLNPPKRNAFSTDRLSQTPRPKRKTIAHSRAATD